MPAQGRPQAAGRSSQFQPGKYEPARSKPEASRGLIWQGSLGLAGSYGSAAFFGTSKARSTPGLLRKPTRGIVPSTLLRLWEGQCLHKAAPRQRGGPASFSQVSTSQPEASQKPTKPLFLIARSQPNQASRGLIWQGSLGLAGSAAVFGTSKARSTPGCFASPHVELCHLLCFVCGRGSACARPPPGSGEVQPVSAR